MGWSSLTSTALRWGSGAPKQRANFGMTIVAAAILSGAGFATFADVSAAEDEEGPKVGTAAIGKVGGVDWSAVRKDVEELMDSKSAYDGNGIGPILVRLAWHAAGTYSQFSKDGGSDGATMRFKPEIAHGANAGLAEAQAMLVDLKKKYPAMSYADLWSFAASVAIEEMGGPALDWTPGRSDDADNKRCTPDGRLPDAAKAHDHIRAIFYRMGFSDREIVALSGAHALGRCHTDRSGFKGPWTRSPDTFSNAYFQQLISNTWTVKKWDGPKQYTDPTGELMMLPSDMALIRDADFKEYVELYAKDEDKFKEDFAAAWLKLQNLGLPEKKKKGWLW